MSVLQEQPPCLRAEALHSCSPLTLFSPPSAPAVVSARQTPPPRSRFFPPSAPAAVPARQTPLPHTHFFRPRSGNGQSRFSPAGIPRSAAWQRRRSPGKGLRRLPHSVSSRRARPPFLPAGHAHRFFPWGAPAVSSRRARPLFLPAGRACRFFPQDTPAVSSAVFYPFTGSQPSGYASGVKTFASSLERYSAPFHQPHSFSANAVPTVIVSGMIRQPSL